MFKRIVLVPIVALFSSVAVYGQQVDKIKKNFLDANSSVVLVASHRAVHHVLPENSIPAVKEAIRLGVDIAEIDVKVSKDGVPFLMHDSKLDRTTNGKGDPEGLTFKQLRKLRLVVDGKKTEEKIPSLEEVLKVAKGNILVDLDLKSDKINPIVEVVRKTGTGGIVFFFDSDYAMLAKVDSMDREFMLMPRAYSYAMADSAIARFKPEVVHIDPKFYTPEVIQLIKQNGARSWINTLGKLDQDIRDGKARETLEVLLKSGVNIIQTDEPELLLKTLASMNRR
jgi:glycerophosphoryl diester phosphodiesterase